LFVTRTRFIVFGLALFVFALPVAAQLKYGVTVTADKNTDFKTLKTYVWEPGWHSNDKKVHAQIVSAIDRELKALGFQLKTSGPSDVIVKYAALRRIDVEVNVLGSADQPRRQFDVGSLQVLMLHPGTGAELLRARIDKPIDVAPAQIEAAVNSAVAEIFAKYPTRK
jgi:hypothetical protein